MSLGDLFASDMNAGRDRTRIFFAIFAAITAVATAIVLSSLAFADASSGAYTSTADFAAGEGVNVTPVDDELKLDGTTKVFNSLWVAASAKGTVVRIDTRTGHVLGEYRTAPEGRPTNPSRTTVDKNGNVWVGNRDELSTLPNGRRGSVAHVGLEENGQCQDRNGNGIIETSTGLGDVRPWPNANGADTPGGVATATDECIIHYVRTLGPQIRHVSVDQDNNVWVAGGAFAQHNSNFYELISPNGQTVRSIGLGRAECCYGGLVDEAGRMWSATVFGANVWRINPGATTLEHKGIGAYSYGMGIDNDQNVWVASWTSCTVAKLRNSDAAVIGRYSVGACYGRGGNGSRGVVITPADNNVWVANSGTDTVSRLTNAGTLIKQVKVGELPTGLAVDSDGKIWVTNLQSSNVQRIDPATNMVELTVPLRQGSEPYNYSDMTGSTLVGAPPSGSWSVTHDSHTPGNEWSVRYNGISPGTSSITVAYSTSENGVDFGPQEVLQSGEDLANKGRFIKLNVTLKRSSDGATPVLYDIAARTANEPPVADAGNDQVVDEGTTVTLDGSGSSDPDGDPIDFHWQRTNSSGPPALLSNSGVETPTYETVDDGSADFELEVADGRESDADQTSVEVRNVVPTVSAAEASGARGGATVLAAKFTDPGALDTHDAVINWGDGTPAENAALTQGVGWGTIVAAHRYTQSGDYTVTVTVTDDDGGSSTAATSVGISTPSAIWANSATDASALDWSGSRNSVSGVIHSNSNLKVTGTNNTVAGGTEYADTFRVNGSNNTFSPDAAKVAVAEMPVRFRLADYQPGGRAAVEAGSGNYFDKSAECAGDGVWAFAGSQLPSGLYYAPCRIELSGESLTGRVTVVSGEQVKVSGSGVELTSFIDGLLLFSGGSGLDAIHLSGAKSTFTGYAFSENGQMHISGSGTKYFCGIVADRIRFSGHDMTIRGNDCGRPTGAVALTNLLPRTEVNLDASRADAIPGDEVKYDVTLANTGSSLITSGLIGGENTGTAGATIAGYAYELEYFRASDQQWVPLAGAAATLPDYAFREPPRATEGVHLALAPMPSGGVDYPAGGDALGTTVAAGSLAAWGYQATVQLTPEQINLLQDEASAPMLRNVVRVEFESPEADLRELYRFGPNFAAQIREQSSAVTNATISLTPPSGQPVLFDAANSPELGDVAAGEHVTVSHDYAVAPLAQRSSVETSAGYRERLIEADGQLLRASARGRAQSDFGTLFMPLARASTARHIPVVTPAIDGPGTVNAGTAAVFGFSLVNDGSAAAAQIAPSNALAGIGSAPVTGAPATLEPGSAGAGTSSVPVPTATPASEATDLGTVEWRDANGNEYGPLEDEVTVNVVPAPKLKAEKTVRLATDVDDSGRISPGDVLEYTVKITNTTAGTATNVLYDDLPDANTTLVPGSLTLSQGSGSVPGEGASTRIIVEGGTLTANAQLTISYRTTIAKPMPENALQVINQGTARSDQTASTRTDDPSRPGSQDQTVAIVTPPTPLLQAQKRDTLKVDADDNGEPSPGDTLKYTVQIENAGGKTGTGIVFTDESSSGLTLLGGTVSTTAGTIVNGNLESDTGIRVEISSLADGAGATIEFDAKIDDVLPRGVRTVVNQGRLFSNELTPIGSDDPDTEVVGDPTETGLLVPLRATAEKTDSLAIDADGNGVASPGDTLGYAVRVKNDNAVPMHAVVLTDQPGANTSLVSGSVSTTAGAVTLGNGGSDDRVEIAIGSLDPDAEATVTFRAKIASTLPAAVYSVENQGSVTAVGLPTTGTDDPDADGSANPTVTEVVRTAANPPHLTMSQIGRLSVDADSVRGPSVGDTISFEVKVTNEGTGPATDVLVSGRPMAPLELVPGSVQGPPELQVLSGNSANDTSAETKLATLFAGSSVTMTYQAKIGPVTDPATTSVTSLAHMQSAETGPATATSTHPLVKPPVQPPAVTIVSPAGGSVVTAPTAVKAEVVAPSGQAIHQACLYHQQQGTTTAVKVSCTTGQPPADGTIATFDPTTLENGAYDLIVRATSSSGGTAEHRVGVSLEGALKPGRFTTTYQDLSVPIHSLPIQVLRSYDSFDKAKGDFGIGWNLQIADFGVRSNGKLGLGGWAHRPSNCFNLGFLGTSCLGKEYVRLAPHFVSVRWPGGRTETFDFTPNPGSDLYYDSTAAFTGRAGATSKLRVAGDPSLTYYGDGNLYDSEGSTPFNPARFELEAKDGTTYLLDTTKGMIAASDRHGNSLSVGPGGIISSTGKSVAFTRDTQNRITQITGPSGETLRYGYNAAGDLVSATDARNNTMSFTYDADHNLLVTKDPQNRPMRTVTYDSAGRMTSVTDGAGNTTQIDTDLADRQQIIDSPDGRSSTITTRDERGNLTKLQEIGGGVTRTSHFEYDSRDNQIKSIDPLGNTSLSSYDSRSNLITSTDALGRVTTFAYDGNDELVKTILPDGSIAQEITRDSNGNPVEVDNGGGDVTTFTYDAAGRPTGATDALGRFLSVTFDANGNPTEYRDPSGLALTTTYDSSNRPVSSTNALGAVTTNTYDVEGNLIKSTDPLGHYTSSTYDFAGRPLTQTDQRGKVVTYQYNDAGQLSRLTDKNGEYTTFTYDANGQLTRALSSDGTESNHTFDALGRMIESINNDARIEQSYDLLGRVTSITTSGVAGSPQPTTTASYEYDTTGKTIAQTTSQGRTAFDYDVRDRLTSIDDPNVGEFNFAYDAEDRLAAITRPNGVATTYTRNVVGDLTDIFHMKGTTTVDEAHYAYDALGQIQSMTDRAGTHSYSYDATGQLTGVNHPGAQPDESFAYDLRGNRISGGETYDAANRLLADAEYLYAYDDEGNMTSKTHRITGARTTFEWDANQRQRAVTTPAGVTTSYKYDPFDRRIEKSSLDGAIHYGFGMGSNPLVEYASDNSVVASFVFGRGPDKPLAMRRDGQSYFHLQDMLANVTSLTDASGARVEDYTYSAFGKQASPTSSVGNPFTYTGRQWDAESETYYNRARQYDPAEGRFLSADPIPSTNEYRYVDNNPIGNRDPSGMFSVSELVTSIEMRANLFLASGFGQTLSRLVLFAGESAAGVQIGAGAAGAVGVGATLPRLKRAFAMLADETGSFQPGAISLNQMRQAIAREQVPKRIHALPSRQEIAEHGQLHVHIKGVGTLNVDGTWKHGGGILTRAEEDLLEMWGWTLPSR